MKPTARVSPLVLARHGLALWSMQPLLRAWTSQPSPVLVLVLVPISIRVDRRTRDAVERRSHRSY